MPKTGKISYTISFEVGGNPESFMVTKRTVMEVNGEGEETIQKFYVGKMKCDSITPPPFDPEHCDKYYVVGPGMGPEGNPKYFPTFEEALAELLGRLLEPPALSH